MSLTQFVAASVRIILYMDIACRYCKLEVVRVLKPVVNIISKLGTVDGHGYAAATLYLLAAAGTNDYSFHGHCLQTLRKLKAERNSHL